MKPRDKSVIPPGLARSSETASTASDGPQTLLLALQERGWLLAVALLAALLAGFVYWIKTPRIFESTATIQVEQTERRVLSEQQVGIEDLRGLDMLNTIVEKIRDSAVLERTVRSASLVPPADPPSGAGDEVQTLEAAIGRLKKNAKITLRRNTRIIDVAVRDRDPERSARLANTLVAEYVALDAEVRWTTTQGALKFLTVEVDAMKRKLEAAERALQQYRMDAAPVSVEHPQEVMLPKLREISTRLVNARAEVIRLRSVFESTRSMPDDVEKLLAYPEIGSEPVVQVARSAVAKLENDLAVVQQRYLPKHPKYQLASTELETMKRRLAQTVLEARNRFQESCRIPYETAVTIMQGLEEELQRAEAEALLAQEKSIDFRLLAREVDADRALFESILNRLKETSLASELAPEKIHVLRHATPPTSPVWPNLTVVLAIASFAGLSAGFALICLLHALDTSINTVEEAEELMSLPVLAAIPRIPARLLKPHRLIVVSEPDGPNAEVFRNLRTALSLSRDESKTRVVLFTSTLAEEGKTLVAANHAASLAMQGHRTLLIDTDFRRPGVGELMLGKRTRRPGVSDFLVHGTSLENLLIRHEELPSLCWIAAGSPSEGSAELLARGGFSALLEEALTKFDRIVIDTAPVHPVSDALLIAKLAHSVIVVLRAGRTPRRIALRTIRLLAGSGASVDGLVVNCLSRWSARSYYYPGYSARRE